MKKSIVSIVGLLLIFNVVLWAADAQGPWVAPAHAARRRNPIPANNASIEAGKVVFSQICIVCHGPQGKGDGQSAASCQPQRPADFTNPAVWDQTDGAIYWKVSEGRGAMPKFEGALTKEQRWNVINFIRTTFGHGKQPSIKIANAK